MSKRHALDVQEKNVWTLKAIVCMCEQKIRTTQKTKFRNSQMVLAFEGPWKKEYSPLVSKIKDVPTGIIQMLLLLDLLLLLLLLLLLYVFNHVLTQGREAPPFNYVVNTYSRNSSGSSSSIWIRLVGNISYLFIIN